MNNDIFNHKYHIIYKTTNTINKMIYIGIHSTDNLEDDYLGSGTHLNKDILKYGRKAFKRKIINIYPNRLIAQFYEREMVNEEFVARADTYNLVCGSCSQYNHLYKLDIQNYKDCDDLLRIISQTDNFLLELISTLNTKDVNSITNTINHIKLYVNQMIYHTIIELPVIKESISQIKQCEEQMNELRNVQRRRKNSFADVSIQNLQNMIKLNKHFLHLYGIDCDGKVNASSRIFNDLCVKPSALKDLPPPVNNEESIDDILSIL